MDSAHHNRYQGFTLIDLMISIAVLAVVAAIAVPSYINYITTARVNTMEYNMRSLRTLLEDERIENGSYGTAGDEFEEEQANSITEISNEYGWEPDSDLSDFTFTLIITAADNYDIWARHNPSRRWRRCDDRMSICCDGDDGNPVACP